MLGALRKNAQNWMIKGVLWLVVAAFIGTIFLVWGRGGDVSKTDMAAIVNNRIISMSQFYNEYQNLEQVYREIYGNFLDKNIIDSETLKKEALESLINRELLREAAEKLKIMVTDDEIQAAIAETPVFSVNGQFSRDRYLDVLRTNGITPKEFEGQKQTDLKLKKLQDFIRGTVRISEKEIKDRYLTLKREIRVNYLTIDPASLKVAAPSKEEISIYYAENKESFRTPAKIKTMYAVFAPENYIDTVEVSEAEISTYYDANQNDYLAPEKRRFHEIVLAYKDEGKKKKVLDKGRKIREEIISGKITFDEASKQYSEVISAENKGKNRWYTKKELPKNASDEVFSLSVDRVTAPIDTGKEVKILKIAEIKKSEPYPLDHVKNSVIRDLKKEKSEDFAIIKAYEAKGKIAKGETFKEAIAAYGLTPITTDLVSHDDADPLLKSIISAAYTLPSGETGEVVKSGQSHIVFTVLEKEASTIKPLTEVEGKIITILTTEKKYQEANKRAEKILAEAKEGKGLKKIAANYNIRVKTTPYFPPISSQEIPGIRLSVELMKNVLSLGTSNRVADKPVRSGEIIYAFEFAGEKEISMNKYDSEKAQITNILFEQKKAAALQAFINEQRERAQIEISGDLKI